MSAKDRAYLLGVEVPHLDRSPGVSRGQQRSLGVKRHGENRAVGSVGEDVIQFAKHGETSSRLQPPRLPWRTTNGQLLSPSPRPLASNYRGEGNVTRPPCPAGTKETNEDSATEN